VSYYADDVVVKDAAGSVLMDRAAAVRRRYAQSMEEHPNVRYEIPNRIAPLPRRGTCSYV